MLATHAAHALATLAAGEQELSALAGLQTCTIHLGASTAPGSYLLPDTLGCFRRDYPDVHVEIEIGTDGLGSARSCWDPIVDLPLTRAVARPDNAGTTASRLGQQANTRPGPLTLEPPLRVRRLRPRKPRTTISEWLLRFTTRAAAT